MLKSLHQILACVEIKLAYGTRLRALSIFVLKHSEICCYLIPSIKPCKHLMHIQCELYWSSITFIDGVFPIWVRFMEWQSVFPREIDLPAWGDSSTTAICRRHKLGLSPNALLSHKTWEPKSVYAYFGMRLLKTMYIGYVRSCVNC